MKKILLLQTGGTISMHFEQGSTELNPDKWIHVLYKEMPELQQIAHIDIENIFFEDSSDINHTHWTRLAGVIAKNIDRYDGFVILHGTDTMAYTASALSFTLRNLTKPVILTGSQVPMSTIRSDARRNLVNAVELATCEINEVAICFNDHLYRGNRSSKMNINDFDAFSSPNYPPLAEIGIKIQLSPNGFRNQTGKVQLLPHFDDAIHVIRLFPNLNPAMLDCLDLTRTKAVIFEAFGIGNMPIKGEYSMLPFVEKCIENNCHIIITSQAAFDAVNLDVYKSGKMLKKLGGLSAGDMTMEATITKSMHLLGLNLPNSEFREQFMNNLAGERQ
ncbi:MAG: asparaginase, partial [Balneolaceae bacterium]